MNRGKYSWVNISDGSTVIRIWVFLCKNRLKALQNELLFLEFRRKLLCFNF